MSYISGKSWANNIKGAWWSNTGPIKISIALRKLKRKIERKQERKTAKTYFGPNRDLIGI